MTLNYLNRGGGREGTLCVNIMYKNKKHLSLKGTVPHSSAFPLTQIRAAIEKCIDDGCKAKKTFLWEEVHMASSLHKEPCNECVENFASRPKFQLLKDE
jgi:hypothetical protein